MISFLIIGALIGVLVMMAIYLLTRPFHEDRKDEYLKLKRSVLVLENWKDVQEANHKASIKLLNDHRALLDRMQVNMKSYEASADQIHKDYIMINCQIVAVERRYADLVPIHRHYHLSDDEIKIKRVTNERSRGAEKKIHRTGKDLSEADFGYGKSDNQAKTNDCRGSEDRNPIPTYSPPNPGTIGSERRTENPSKGR